MDKIQHRVAEGLADWLGLTGLRDVAAKLGRAESSLCLSGKQTLNSHRKRSLDYHCTRITIKTLSTKTICAEDSRLVLLL